MPRPPKNPDAPRLPSGRFSRAKPGAVRGGSKPHGAAPLAAVLRLRVTEAEAADIAAAAQAAGLPVAAWLRAALVAHLEAVGGMPGATPWLAARLAADASAAVGVPVAVELTLLVRPWQVLRVRA